MNESDFELAARNEQAERDAATARARQANAPQYHPDFDGEHCVACGEQIPIARLAMGKVRCVECQEREERRHG